jgi:hypothetical protein
MIRIKVDSYGVLWDGLVDIGSVYQRTSDRRWQLHLHGRSGITLHDRRKDALAEATVHRQANR